MARSSRKEIAPSRPTIAGPGAGLAPAGAAEKPKRGRKPGRPRGPGRPRAERKSREKKNVISRLVVMAKAVFGKSDKLYTLMGNISAEATPEQTKLFQVVGVALAGVHGKAGAVVEALESLAKTGFDPVLVKAPKGPRGLAAGATVAIKPKRWNPALYGKVNNFEVVVCVDKMVRLQSAADSKAPQFVLARAWVEEIEAAADDPTDPVEDPIALEDVDPDEAAPPSEDETEELPE
jgi:hypothetical protein